MKDPKLFYVCAMPNRSNKDEIGPVIDDVVTIAYPRQIDEILQSFSVLVYCENDKKAKELGAKMQHYIFDVGNNDSKLSSSV